MNEQKSPSENEVAEECSNVEDFIQFHKSWVGSLVDDSCTYYQDRDKQYKFYTGEFGFRLLNELLDNNAEIFRANHELTKTTKNNLAEAYAEGKKIYCEKMALTKGKGTWSAEEYAHPGFQRMYLHIKSFRGLTETWSLLERAQAEGLFDVHRDSDSPIRIASICGGPGYELDTARKFLKKIAPQAPVELISLDLCSTWEKYTEILGIRFITWDSNEASLLETCGLDPGELTYIIISYGMVHCSQPHLLEMYQDLLLGQGVRALLVSERNQRLQACSELEQRGLRVVKLMDQSREQDDRQVVVVGNPDFLHSTSGRMESIIHEKPVFPNNPYSLAEFLDYYKRKSRSRMCPDLLRTGNCAFRDHCKFAHRVDELREPSRPKKESPKLSWRKEHSDWSTESSSHRDTDKVFSSNSTKSRHQGYETSGSWRKSKVDSASITVDNFSDTSMGRKSWGRRSADWRDESERSHFQQNPGNTYRSSKVPGSHHPISWRHHHQQVINNTDERSELYYPEILDNHLGWKEHKGSSLSGSNEADWRSQKPFHIQQDVDKIHFDRPYSSANAPFQPRQYHHDVTSNYFQRKINDSSWIGRKQTGNGGSAWLQRQSFQEKESDKYHGNSDEVRKYSAFQFSHGYGKHDQANLLLHSTTRVSAGTEFLPRERENRDW